MSIVEEIMTRLEARMADPSVLFLGGKRRLAQNARKRRITFVRSSGMLSLIGQPDGVTVTSSGKTKKLFRRAERFLVTLRADDEEELDELFDRCMCATWEEFAPNVFVQPSEYEWANGDSQDGGSHMASSPSLTVAVTFRFEVSRKPTLVTVVNTATITSDLE